MVLRDAVIDMWPAPCGAVLIAAHLGLRVTRVVADGFLAPRLPVWSTNALDLQAAFARFGYLLRFAGGFPDPCPPLADWLEYDREPLLRAPPVVVAVEEDAQPRHWLAIHRDQMANAGRWARIEDMDLSRWGVRSAWWVRRR
jgi:hypothetical protein